MISPSVFNYWAFLVQVVGYSLGVTIISAHTILPLFLSRLGASNFAIGLIPGIVVVGELFPQLFVARWVERLPRKTGYVFILGTIERLTYLLMAVCVLLLGVTNPPVLVILFFGCWALYNLSIGVNSPAFFGLFSETVPAGRRGGLFGIGNGASAVLAIGASALIALVFTRVPSINSFAILFVLGFGVQMVSWLPISRIRERPRGTPAGPGSETGGACPSGLISMFRRAFSFLGTDVNLRWYIIAQNLFSLGAVVRTFFVVYAIRNFSAGAYHAAIITGISTAAAVIGNIVWGTAADRCGHRLVLLCAFALQAGATAIVLAARSMDGMWAAFALAGLAEGGLFVSSTNIILEFCPTENVPTYTALASTLMAPVRFAAAALAGFSVDRLGFTPLFGMAVVTIAGAWSALLFGIREPRRRLGR